MKNTFRKSERLCSKKWIEELYHQGTSFRVYPLKITLLSHHYAAESAVTTLISSPKHLHKHAKDRNLNKRRIREAYRKNKHTLLAFCNSEQHKVFIGFQYASKKQEDFIYVELALQKALIKVQEQLANLKNTSAQ